MSRDADENGWASSAAPWITRMGNTGDFSRAHVLDAPMLARAGGAIAREAEPNTSTTTQAFSGDSPKTALDVGCGEGRFCRMLSLLGFACTGLDPVREMIDAAATRDPEGCYVQGFAEALPFETAAFDLVVSYLSLIDIDDVEAALAEMAGVLRPGGCLLIANLTSFSTSSSMEGRPRCADTGRTLRPLGDYLTVRKAWFEWDGLRVQNWHRPLSAYMRPCLNSGLSLTYFDEPTPTGGPPERIEAYRNMPYLMMMEWQK